MSGSFQYEWWTVKMSVQGHGLMTAEYKAKSREHAVKQIKKDVEFTNSEKNLTADVWHRQNRITDVLWDTLTLDRVGYQSGCRRID